MFDNEMSNFIQWLIKKFVSKTGSRGAEAGCYFNHFFFFFSW